MSVRRNTKNRLNLIRTCYICGKVFSTTADTPWIRQLYNVEGKKQKTCYFCSGTCMEASYKYKSWYDGKTEQRRKEREANRDRREKNRRYYRAHAEEIKKAAKERRARDPERYRLENEYQRKKRKLLQA